MSDLEEKIPTRPSKKPRLYYSDRQKQGNRKIIALPSLRKFFAALVRDFEHYGYLSQTLGTDCVDGDIAGELIGGADAALEFSLGKNNLWPIKTMWSRYTEDDVFDLIEFIFDHISKPTDGFLHRYNGCGWHFTQFDRLAGQAEFRAEINQVLGQYEKGSLLSGSFHRLRTS
jgi:hypothetical protein